MVCLGVGGLLLVLLVWVIVVGRGRRRIGRGGRLGGLGDLEAALRLEAVLQLRGGGGVGAEIDERLEVVGDGPDVRPGARPARPA